MLIEKSSPIMGTKTSSLVAHIPHNESIEKSSPIMGTKTGEHSRRFVDERVPLKKAPQSWGRKLPGVHPFF